MQVFHTRWILRSTSPSTGGVGWRDSRRLFDGCRTRGRTTHGTSCWRFCSSLLRRHCVARSLGHGHVWAIQGRAVATWSCSCSTGCPATTPSAGSSACWTRGRSRPHSAGSWQASPRPTDWNCAAWWRWTAKPCGVPSSAASKVPRCTWSTSGRRKRECAWLSARPLAATRQRAPGGPGPAGPRRLYRYRGCTALPSRLCHHGARAGCGLRAGAQGEPEQVVRCGRSALCPQRSPQRCRTARTRHSRSLRMAARDRLARYHFAAVRSSPASLRLARITSRRQRAWWARRACRYATSCSPQIYSRQARLLHIVRSHWGIENQLHWVLDVVFNEDRNRTRKDNAPENLAILRKLALNLVRSHPAATSLRQKIKRAGWDDALPFLGMLSHMR